MKRLTKGLNHESNAFKHFNTDGIDYPRYLAKWPTENGYMGRVNIFASFASSDCLPNYKAS